MTYIRCNACPDRWNCDFSKCCWNDVARQQSEINSKLSAIDKVRESRIQIVTPVGPFCSHNERSPIGICLNCGHW